ncbi:uncharacterized protein LOC119643031 [Glossina fuscipes]|uniref:Uncharacterized protein LOC119643031 n=1 Tax=Glossina fuscipes TaxID=7396 RepID=A0A9C5ZNL2_9MUSC|nr:uncharacterized protein LOC119643031 [Glossina fuscipes]
MNTPDMDSRSTINILFLACTSNKQYYIINLQVINERHCLLDVQAKNKIFIVDLESISGVFIEGEKIRSLERHPLKLGDTFSVGRQSKAKIELVGREDQPSTSQAKRRKIVTFVDLPTSGGINNSILSDLDLQPGCSTQVETEMVGVFLY